MAFESGWGHDGLAYSGKEMRELVAALTNEESGVVGASTAMAVSQQTVAAATVKVAEGGAIIPATGAGLGGSYQVWNDADLTSPTISPTAANGRKDRLIIRVTAGVPALEVVEGTASGSPAEPTITGDNYLELALITLPASTTNITDAMITDRRVRLDRPQYSARAWRSAALDIAAAPATTLIAMDTESWDYNSNFDTGTGRYTVPVKGIYHVSGTTSFNVANNPDELELNIWVNAAIRTAGDRAVIRGGTAGDDWTLSVSDLLDVDAGDVIDLRVDHLQGGNVCAVNLGAIARNFISISKVG